MTSARSRVFDSRFSDRPGIGFPSCNTELCRVPPNNRDPHGYYAELGVPPWATPDQIRSAARSLYRRLHPDTGTRPDPERLQRVKLVAEVLLDPESRERYNQTPPGHRLLDPVYRSELSALDFTGMSPKEVEEILTPVLPKTGPRWYDYLAVDRQGGEMHLAQRWYAALVQAAPLVGYRRRIKVLVHDGPAFFHPETSVMAVPRHWKPSTGLAYGLFTVLTPYRAGKSSP